MRTALALALLIVAAGHAHTQDAPKKDAAPDLQARFTRADANKDGKVTFEEVKELIAQRDRARLKADGKGAAEKEKTERAWADVLEVDQFLKADSDDDLILTQAELKAALTKGPPQKYSAKDLESLTEFHWIFDVKVYDRNRNNQLERDEWPGDDLKAFSGYDGNSDGTVTREEYNAAAKKLKWYKEALDNVDTSLKDKMEVAEKEAADAQPWALYTKDGRCWIHRTTTEGKPPSLWKVEVDGVGKNSAEVRSYEVDKTGKEVAGTSQVTTIDFKAKPPKPDANAKVETIKVEAGEFECTFSESGGRKVWMSKRFPQLLVKSEDSGAKRTVELVQFSE